ncbi:Uncharacterised protein [Vibrio cholerae]|nr:Uncharacterised protein [Vibrio cholerae]
MASAPSQSFVTPESLCTNGFHHLVLCFSQWINCHHHRFSKNE